MRIINSSAGLSVGDSVTIIKKYENGSMVLDIGDKGEVTGVYRDSFPDFGLINITIVSFKFGKNIFAAGEKLMKSYLRRS